MMFLLIFSSVCLAWTFYAYDLTVGTLSLEDYYLFAYIFEWPWGKFHGPVFGCLVGWLYINIKSYRKVTEAEKPTYKFIHKCHTTQIPTLIALFGFCIFNAILFLPYNPNNNAYSWTKS